MQYSFKIDGEKAQAFAKIINKKAFEDRLYLFSLGGNIAAFFASTGGSAIGFPVVCTTGDDYNEKNFTLCNAKRWFSLAAQLGKDVTLVIDSDNYYFTDSDGSVYKDCLCAAEAWQDGIKPLASEFVQTDIIARFKLPKKLRKGKVGVFDLAKKRIGIYIGRTKNADEFEGVELDTLDVTEGNQLFTMGGDNFTVQPWKTGLDAELLNCHINTKTYLMRYSINGFTVIAMPYNKNEDARRYENVFGEKYQPPTEQPQPAQKTEPKEVISVAVEQPQPKAVDPYQPGSGESFVEQKKEYNPGFPEFPENPEKRHSWGYYYDEDTERNYVIDGEEVDPHYSQVVESNGIRCLSVPVVEGGGYYILEMKDNFWKEEDFIGAFINPFADMDREDFIDNIQRVVERHTVRQLEPEELEEVQKTVIQDPPKQESENDSAPAEKTGGQFPTPTSREVRYALSLLNMEGSRTELVEKWLKRTKKPIRKDVVERLIWTLDRTNIPKPGESKKEAIKAYFAMG